MKTFNFEPFWESSVGFDRLLNLIDDTTRVAPADPYPPYNIAKTGDNTFRISIAVPGFRPDQISVIAHQNVLTVVGQTSADGKKVTYLHRGIAGTPFERRFNLADFVEVTNASFQDGMLDVDLERRIPETMKPRRIEVKTTPAAQPTIESSAA